MYPEYFCCGFCTSNLVFDMNVQDAEVPMPSRAYK